MPTARRLLHLQESFGALRLEAACERANFYGDPTYMTVKRILVNELDSVAAGAIVSSPPAAQFVRKTGDILGKWVEALSWN